MAGPRLRSRNKEREANLSELERRVKELAQQTQRVKQLTKAKALVLIRSKPAQ